MSTCGGGQGNPTWIPVPSHSLVANVDALSQRPEVCGCSTGRGVNSRGLFEYLATYGQNALTFMEVQGNNGQDINRAGQTAVNAGDKPTFDWMFKKLELGFALYVTYGDYDDQGNYLGGHAVRVFGAEQIGDKRYLHYLHDGQQCAAGGLENSIWEVEDFSQPGGGPANGFLNVNGRSDREIRAVLALIPVNQH